MKIAMVFFEIFFGVFLLGFFCTVPLLAQDQAAQPPNIRAAEAPVSDKTLVGKVTEEHPDIDESILNKAVDPCDDFYHYACGGWLAKTPIPEDRAIWGRGFSVIDERNKETLRDILEGYRKGGKTPDVPYVKKLGDFYAAC